jgi:GTP-binding protein HflX
MERALLVTVDFGERGGWTAAEQALELKELTESAGARVIGQEIVARSRPDPGHFIGTGKAEEFARICADNRINIVIFNNDLSGTQQKNLEEIIMAKTIDRTQLILDIFARHARSNEGKIQVELAQLLYMLPRLAGKGIYLSRLGGGIGTRGPGEQKLEVDRRHIRSRIAGLEEDLGRLSRRRAMMRKNRGRFSALTIAIIGYTNVGKSTLLNALTGSDAIVEDRLFSTLDPTVRRLILPNKQKALFVDTVGFLDRLPHHLIEAFKATLEEVVEADLLLLLVDASHPKAVEQSDAVYAALGEIGAHAKPVLTVFNKIDKLDNDSQLERLRGRFHNAVSVSALKKEGFDALIARIRSHVSAMMTTVKGRLPASDAKTLSMLYENGLVLKTEYSGDHVYIEAELPIRLKEFLRDRFE